ncbi:DUF2844 domain-containing protein [Paraburkholderia sp. Ac-20340]|uniref:DUF2844 domain-containing protein n=1 Tax=Paraburkholderia sp. Ac-20340 TaxID=2703888 RepID=UPI00197FDF77
MNRLRCAAAVSAVMPAVPHTSATTRAAAQIAVLVAVLVSGSVFCAGAHAALGGQPTLPMTSVRTSEAVALKATSSTSTASSTSTSTTYTVRESTLDNGVTEREYLNVDGTVFALAWDGPFIPDLRTFMGSTIFSEYVAALQSQTNRQRNGGVNISTDDFVVQVQGHQRHFHGRAWLPSLLPTDLSTSVIQ